MSTDTAVSRLLVVDDDPRVLKSLKAYFDSTEDLDVVATANQGAEALTALSSLDIDLILADVHMPTMDGMELLRAVKKLPHPPVFVAMTGFDTDDSMLRTLTAGASGYIIKSSPPQTIISSVRDALSGGTAVSPRALARLIKYIPSYEFVPASGEEVIELSTAEQRVLALVCDGLSNAEISARTGYAESTVKKHVSGLISHFGASSRLSLAVTVMRTSWADN